MVSQIKITIIVVLVVSTFAGGWKSRSWYEDSKQKDIIEKEIVDHNEGVEAINETVRTVEKIKYIYRDKIIRLPAIIVDPDCPIDPSTELRNSSYRHLDQSLFQSSDEVPEANP